MSEKYRKKPVVIKAMQFTSENYFKCLRFITCTCSGFSTNDAESYIEIHTLEGIMTARIGDWIIKGVNGEFYPCKPDIFEKTYEPADNTRAADQTKDAMREAKESGMSVDLGVLRNSAEIRIKEIYTQREEILSAFVAKYGFDPDQAEQVEQTMDDLSKRWYIRRKQKDNDPAKDAMRDALNNLADAVDKWNAAVEVVIGRQPETGMATAEARAALALDKEQNGFQRNLATASKIVEKWPDWKKSLLKGSGKEQNDAKP